MSASKIVLLILNICITILFIVLVFFGLTRLGTESYNVGYRIFTEKSMESAPGKDIVVEIPENMSALEMGTLFEEKGLIEDSYLFVLQMKLSAYADKVKPGLYTLNTSQTVRELLQVMSAEPESEETEE